MQNVRTILLICIFCSFLISVAGAQPGSACIQAVEPPENAVLQGKKPKLSVTFSCSVKYETLFVTLDGIDITQVLTKSDQGFAYDSPVPLTAGAHVMVVIVQDRQGISRQKIVQFSTRQSEKVEEASVKGDASVIYEGALVKPKSPSSGTVGGTNLPGTPPPPQTEVSIPSSKLEGNLRTDMRLKVNPWEVTLAGNVRYFDQNAPAQSPLEKGFSIANWLMTAGYNKDKTKLKLSLGDIAITETPYTISGLARKGTVLNAEYDNLFANAFISDSRQRFGADGGVGWGDVNDDHLWGASAGVRLFQRKMEIRGVYVRGADPSSSAQTLQPTPQQLQTTPPSPFATTTNTGHRTGSVYGILVTSNFFENRFRTEAEIDFSRFDADVSDEFGRKNDKAFRLKADGMLGAYTYLAQYEYIGRDYASIANAAMERDRQKLMLTQGLNFGPHMFNLALLRANDNVSNDDLFARITNYNGVFSYSYTGVKNLPMGLSYTKDFQESSREPANFLPVDRMTDTVSAWISYMWQKFSIGFTTSLSSMNDRTETNADSKSYTFALSPSYNDLSFSAGAGLSYNRSHSTAAGFWTDTYTASAMLRKSFFNNTLSIDTADSYTISKADNGSIDMKTLNCTGTVSYNLKDIIKHSLQPTLSLRSGYLKIWDKVNQNSRRDEFTLYLVLTTLFPFAL